MILKDYRITMIKEVKKRNQAIKSILKIKVQTLYKELGYEIKL
jgi:hypothetical protein